MNEKHSVCPHDCPDTCGLVVGEENGRIAWVKGDPDHPFTRGSLCPKVNRYHERVHSTRRLLHPLKSTGAKGEGQFEQVTWDQALDEIAEKYRDILNTHGGEAILPYSYSGTMGVIQRSAGHAFFHKLGASRLWRTICSNTAEAGFNASLGPGPSTDIESTVDSDLIVLWGSNTLTTNVHAWPFFLQARKNGAQIVSIDPYANRTAQQCERHYALKPGTDAALALGMMHMLIRGNLIDHDFIARRTLGFDALKERAGSMPPDRAAEITGLPASDIEELALLYGRAQAPYIRLGWGPARQLRGGMAVRTIALLPALVGAFEKKGGGITRSTGAAAKLKKAKITREDLGPQDVRTVNMVELGRALNNLTDPPVMALHVYQSNPAVVAPDSNQVIKGLSRSDLFVVVHEMFPTETVKYADYVLPAASSMETTDLYTCYGHYYLMMAQPVIPPVGESRSTLAIFQDLAGRFDFEEEIFHQSEEDLIKLLLPDDSQFFKGITYERLAECRAVRLNLPENPWDLGFSTPSGKVEFYSESMKTQGLDPLPDPTPSQDEQHVGKYPLQMITPPRHYFLNTTFNEVDALREKAGPPTIMIHPKDASARNLENKDMVRVFNDRGEIQVFADITDKVCPGVTVVEGVYWPEYMPGGSGINCLTNQQPNDMGGSCAFHCNLVAAEKAS
jgi:anaerobic selenocysteine-containing dehydrogenase